MAKRGDIRQAEVHHDLHEPPSLWKRWATAIGTIFVLSIFATMITGMLHVVLFGEKAPFGNVGVIPIQGIILTEKARGAFASPSTSSEDVVKFLQDAAKDDNIKAVLLEINSPGGSAVASYEIAQEVKKTREKKPVISVIREAGASGAFWIATASGHIFANPLSSTGSIGVVSSYIEYAGLLDRFNVTYQRLVVGKYKDSGSPFKRLTNEERRIIQEKLDIVGDAFVKAVAENRNLSIEKVREYATGMVFLGSEAKDMGLIDELGSKQDAITYIEHKLNITAQLTEYEKVPSLIDVISGASARMSPLAGGSPLPSPYLDRQGFDAIAPQDPTFYT